MGYIKEPDGVDFVIKSTPLTDKDRREIEAYLNTIICGDCLKVMKEMPISRLSPRISLFMGTWVR